MRQATTIIISIFIILLFAIEHSGGKRSFTRNQRMRQATTIIISIFIIHQLDKIQFDKTMILRHIQFDNPIIESELLIGFLNNSKNKDQGHQNDRNTGGHQNDENKRNLNLQQEPVTDSFFWLQNARGCTLANC